MGSKKQGSEPLAVSGEGRFPLRDEDIVAKPVSRRSALSLLGVGSSAGALGLLLGGCVSMTADADPTDGVGGGGGGGGGGYGGGGGGSERHHDIKLGDGSDYPVYADGRDLDSDARDSSDHAHTRSADRSSSNDYD